jgi:hypothetical protein
MYRRKEVPDRSGDIGRAGRQLRRRAPKDGKTMIAVYLIVAIVVALVAAAMSTNRELVRS